MCWKPQSFSFIVFFLPNSNLLILLLSNKMFYKIMKCFNRLQSKIFQQKDLFELIPIDFYHVDRWKNLQCNDDMACIKFVWENWKTKIDRIDWLIQRRERVRKKKNLMKIPFSLLNKNLHCTRSPSNSTLKCIRYFVINGCFMVNRMHRRNIAFALHFNLLLFFFSVENQNNFNIVLDGVQNSKVHRNVSP